MIYLTIEMENINDFCTKLEKLNLENDKTTFLDNYKEYQDKINSFDKLLNEPNQFIQMEIKDLFELLNYYESKKDLTVHELKTLKDIIETLETKINKETMEIKTF